MSRIERGKQVPSVALLSVLAKAFNLTLANLLQRVLPGSAPDSAVEDDDPTMRLVRSLSKTERRSLLGLLQALQRWKDGA